jgi:hypothetical protein
MAEGAIVFGRLERLTAFPRALRGRLATGMSKLDAELGGAVAAAMVDQARERRFAIVGIEAEATVRNAAATLNAGCFDHEQRGAGICQHAEVSDMPVRGDAVDGAVLAHGRYDDAVGKLEVAEPDRGEQGTGHGARGMIGAAKRNR